MISDMAMAGRYSVLIAVMLALLLSCSFPEEQSKGKEKTYSPVVILKPKPQGLTSEQRSLLGFPTEIVTRVEAVGGALAEPFYETVLTPSENLRGTPGIEKNRLAGFSVRTTRAEKVIDGLSRSLRSQGYLIFRSEQNFGSVPDVVTVVRGNNSYDIVKLQRTEAQNYHLTTDKIIAWLKARQKQSSFVITGAGADWLEARFVKPPKNMRAFAQKVAAFAPDVVSRSGGTVEKIVVQMKKLNGFYLWWE